MNKSEFTREFKMLAASFPQFRPAAPLTFTDMLEAWFRELSPFDLGRFRHAVEACTRARPEFFPTLPDVLQSCWGGQRKQQAPRLTHAFAPLQHGCDGGAEPGEFERRFTICRQLAYEMQHVRCPGQMQVICPNCGKIEASGAQEELVRIMAEHPAETRGWNPCLKGAWLCAACLELVA